MLALDHQSLQHLINTVYNYCTYWGLTVNLSKTAVMVFNSGGRLLKDSQNFKYGDLTVPSARTYCYLGIVFSLSGSLKPAQDELRKKGLRAYFSLKKLINLKVLSTISIFKLFSALIMPVFSYACQVWIYNTEFFRLMASGRFLTNISYTLKRIASDPVERIHLKLLKWSMSVGPKSSNLACWGDSGRPVGHHSLQV